MTGKELYWLLNDFRDVAKQECNLFLAVNSNPDAGSPEDEHITLDIVDENGKAIEGTCPIVKVTCQGNLEYCSVTLPETKVGAVVALKRALDNQ